MLSVKHYVKQLTLFFICNDVDKLLLAGLGKNSLVSTHKNANKIRIISKNTKNLEYRAKREININKFIFSRSLSVLDQKKQQILKQLKPHRFSETFYFKK